MSDESITVTGLQEVQRTLYRYSQQLGDRVVRGALRQGANYVLKGIKELVPVRTGLLQRRGFRVANSKIHNGKASTDMIGIYISLRKKKGDPFYGRFQNDGWLPQGPRHGIKGGDRKKAVERFRQETAGGKKRVPGKGFVQRAFNERKAAAVQLIVSSAEAGAEVVKRRLGMK